MNQNTDTADKNRQGKLPLDRSVRWRAVRKLEKKILCRVWKAQCNGVLISLSELPQPPKKYDIRPLVLRRLLESGRLILEWDWTLNLPRPLRPTSFRVPAVVPRYLRP